MGFQYRIADCIIVVLGSIGQHRRDAVLIDRRDFLCALAGRRANRKRGLGIRLLRQDPFGQRQLLRIMGGLEVRIFFRYLRHGQREQTCKECVVSLKLFICLL